MRFYTKTHEHYCGIDLHAKTMYLCILDGAGEILLHKNMKSRPEAFLEAVAPYREGLVVAVECMFTWYWLADLCRQEGIEFVLGHALYMKAIHGGKAKNDKVDAFKIAALLRGGNLPQAYVYPPEMRGHPGSAAKASSPRPATSEPAGPHPEHPPPVQPARAVRQGRLQGEPGRRRRGLRGGRCPQEPGDRLRAHRTLRRGHPRARAPSRATRQAARPPGLPPAPLGPRHRQDPGAHDPLRDPRRRALRARAGFPLVRAAREVRSQLGGQEARHRRCEDRQRHLKWAFSEAAVLFLRNNPAGQTHLRRLAGKHGKAKALSILAAKLGRPSTSC